MIDNHFYSLKGDKLMPRKDGARFITIEGPDGAGKTTQANLLKDYFLRSGYNVFLTKEPTLDSEFGKRIKKMLYGEEKMIDPKSFQKLYIEDRRIHVEKEIIPALQEGKIVIGDRYFFATFAHGMLDADNVDDLISLNNDFVMPDVALTILAKPETCIKRLNEKGIELDFFERLDKIEKIDSNYRKLVDRFKNMVILDGEQNIETVNEASVKLIKDRLKL